MKLSSELDSLRVAVGSCGRNRPLAQNQQNAEVVTGPEDSRMCLILVWYLTERCISE